MPAGAVSLVGLVNPVVGTLLGVAFAGEVFGWPQALGMALVLGGVVAGQRYGARPAPPVVPEPVVEPSPSGARAGDVRGLNRRSQPTVTPTAFDAALVVGSKTRNFIPPVREVIT